MISMRNVLGVMLLAVLASVAFAVDVLPQENLRQSQVVFLPSENNGLLLKAGVITFEPATSQAGTDIRDVMEGIVRDCASEADRQACIQRRALEVTAASGSDYQMNLQYVQDAHLVFEYYNPMGAASRGGWTVIPECSNVVASTAATAYRPDPETGTPVAYTYYYGTCNIAPAVG